MATVEFALRRHLLAHQHRALVVLGTNKHEINREAPRATLKSGDLGTIGISYNGIRFNISSISGDVAVNNTILVVGDELPACCVIAFGPSGSHSRVYATFDVSNPEVMP
jgi:hypothetical protein